MFLKNNHTALSQMYTLPSVPVDRLFKMHVSC